MKFEEALKLMRKGKKMADGWCNKRSYFFIYKGEFCHHCIDCDGAEQVEQGCSMLTSARIMKNDWHEYKDPILTDKENAYLEAVLRPFKDRVKSITKTFMPNTSPYKELNDNYRLDIKVMLYNNDNVGTIIQLPPFYTKSNMYENIVPNQEYTLKELGLFEREN